MSRGRGRARGEKRNAPPEGGASGQRYYRWRCYAITVYFAQRFVKWLVPSMQRVVAYVDGFNLYFGMRDRGWKRYYWLDVRRLATALLQPQQQLQRTKYFTARISAPPDKRMRQSTYIEALETLPDLGIYYGKYQTNPRICRYCGRQDFVPSEKMTDVNMAVELMTDAFQDAFDTALLISADSDLVGPVVAVRRLFPSKRIIVAFPPRRQSVALAGVASAYLQIGRASLGRSLLLPQLRKFDGTILHRPPSWT